MTAIEEQILNEIDYQCIHFNYKPKKCSFQKSGAAAFMMGGSSVMLYLFRWLWSNLSSLLIGHKEYILAYLGRLLSSRMLVEAHYFT